jgi:hypothetical protein
LLEEGAGECADGSKDWLCSNINPNGSHSFACINTLTVHPSPTPQGEAITKRKRLEHGPKTAGGGGGLAKQCVPLYVTGMLRTASLSTP